MKKCPQVEGKKKCLWMVRWWEILFYQDSQTHKPLEFWILMPSSALVLSNASWFLPGSKENLRKFIPFTMLMAIFFVVVLHLALRIGFRYFLTLVESFKKYTCENDTRHGPPVYNLCWFRLTLCGFHSSAYCNMGIFFSNSTGHHSPVALTCAWGQVASQQCQSVGCAVSRQVT